MERHLGSTISIMTESTARLMLLRHLISRKTSQDRATIKSGLSRNTSVKGTDTRWDSDISMAKVVMDSQEPMHISQGWRWHIKIRIKRSSVGLDMEKGWTLRRAYRKHQDQGIIICRHLWINIIKRKCLQPITDTR